MSNYFIVLLVINIVIGYIIIFVIGILLGKYLFFEDNNYADNRKKIKNRKNISSNSDVSIDDTKLVLEINTNKLEKKFTQIAQTIETDNNIQSSVNKLKNMKGA